MDDPHWPDRLAIRDVAYRYARAIDRRDYALAEAIFSEDAELIGPGFHVTGRDKVVDGMRAIERFESTMHVVHNQLVEVLGNRAEGETYGVAYHVLLREGRRVRIDWGIRYQDRYVREDGTWRLARRALELDWVLEHDLGKA